jgi:hypothetical protein
MYYKNVHTVWTARLKKNILNIVFAVIEEGTISKVRGGCG